MLSLPKVGNVDIFQGTYKVTSPCFIEKQLFTVIWYVYRVVRANRIVVLFLCLLPDIFPQLFVYFWSDQYK